MASAQLNELFGAASDFAKEMLAREGAFHPFGVSMNRDGAVSMVAGYTGTDYPPAPEILALLTTTFTDQAKSGAIQAAGVCFDVRVVPPGQSERMDAICVRLATTSGETIDVFVPYQKSGNVGATYGPVFASAGQFRIHDV